MLPLQIAHIIVTVLLGTVILLQQRSSGLGDAFGDSGATFTSRRGAEKVLFYLTIIFGVSFVALAVLQLFVSQ